MNCVNISSKEFKDLLKSTELSSIDLEFKISEWQKKNNTEEYPTAMQIGVNIQQKLIDKFKDVDSRMTYNEEDAKKRKNDKSLPTGYSIKDKVTGIAKQIFHRVSDRVEKLDKKRNWAERTPEEKAVDDIKRIYGTQGHNALNNIIKRFTENLDGKIVTQKDNFGLNDKVYLRLEKYFTEVIAPSFGPGCRFISEIRIYDTKTDEAGTIDLLVIKPDGRIAFLDWKFIDLSGKDTIPWYKEENWNVQLGRYKSIIHNNYGVPLDKFDETRVAPIEVKYVKNKDTKKWEPGDIVVAGKRLSPDYLYQVPLTDLQNSGIEKTGDEQLDSLVTRLLAQRERLSNSSAGTKIDKRIKAERIEKINNTIKEIIVKKDIENFILQANSELDLLSAKYKSLSPGNLKRSKDLMDFYANIRRHLPLNLKKKYSEELSDIADVASDLYSQLEKQQSLKLVELAKQNDIEGINDPTDSTSALGRLFRSISQSNNPIIKTFYRLIKEQKAKIYKNSKDLEDKIQKSIKNLIEESGFSGNKIFDPMLGRNADGTLTGNLIDVYTKEFNIERNKAFVNKDFAWIVKNMDFDDKLYKESFEKEEKEWKEYYKDSKDAEQYIEEKMEKYDKKYNALNSNNSNTAIHKYNRFIKVKKEVKDKNTSKEYKYIQSKPALKAFYELFTDTIKQYSKDLDIDTQYGKFIPNIEKDLVDHMFNMGEAGITGTWGLIKDHYKTKSEDSIGMVDENGKAIKKVPIFYTTKIDADKKSYDLGRSLALFGQMAINYKYMSEVEGAGILLQDAMNEQKIVLSNNKGNPKIDKLSGKIAEITKSASDIEQFNSYMNYYLYGMTLGEDDKIGDLALGQYSGKKIFRDVLKTFAGKALGLNVFSGLANGLGGVSNAFFEGVKGRFYNNKHYSSAVIDISTRNKTSVLLMHYFDIDSTESGFKRANNLSASKVVKEFTWDKLMILQRSGDYVVENSVLLAMCKSHTIENGKIVKITKSTQKSIEELTSETKDGIKIEGLTDEEFGKFRNKVKYLYSEMKGNSNPEDISQIKMSILGSSLMMFRNWIPRMADERIGNLRYVGELDVWEEGRYKAMFHHMTHNILSNFLSTIGSAGLFGIGKGNFDSALELEGTKRYQKMLLENPDLKITEEEYVKLYKENVKATIAEVQVLISIAVGVACLINLPDDEKKKPLLRNFIKLGNRAMLELGFWYSPDQAVTLLKTPVPIIGYAAEITQFLSDFTGQSVGAVQYGLGATEAGEARMDKNHPLRKFGKLWPGINSLETIWNTAYPNYYNKK